MGIYSLLRGIADRVRMACLYPDQVIRIGEGLEEGAGEGTGEGAWDGCLGSTAGIILNFERDKTASAKRPLASSRTSQDFARC